MDAIQSKGIIKDAITTLTGNFGFYQGNIVQGRKSLLCSSKLNEWVFDDSLYFWLQCGISLFFRCC